MANAHSLARFADLRFFAVAGDFYRNGIKILDSVFDGTRLIFAKMPPTTNVDVTATQIADHLFIAGGGTLKKVDATGDVSNWGIEAPPDGFTATKQSPDKNTIDDFESAASWTPASATLTDEGSIKIEGTNSMKMVVAANTSGSAAKGIIKDLTIVGARVSSDADTINVWFRANFPDRIDNIQIAFDLVDGTFNTDFYSRIINISPNTIPQQQIGIGSLDSVIDTQVQFVSAVTADGLPLDANSSLANQIASVAIPLNNNLWTQLRIPKLGFTRSGGDTTLGWKDVEAVKLTVKTNTRGAVNAYWDIMELNGGAGMQGRYRYYVTFLNNSTGSRSNPNDNYVEVTDVQRGTVLLALLPNSADPQVTHLEIWRTLGDGSFFFFVDKVVNGQANYTDRTSDYLGLGDSTANVLEDTELTFDNIKPSSTFEYCAGPHQGRMWWCNDTEDGKGGRAYFSGAGRAEGVQSFIDCTSSDDQTQGYAIWNGSIYCFAESGIFEILGTDQPFVPRRVYGCPGTTKPSSITRTPAGVVYEAHDGVRIFNGSLSVLLYFDAVSRIMRQETVEGIAGFVPVFGTYGRDEVYLGDGVITLACNLPEGRWRNVGIDANAMNFEEDTGELLAAFNNKVLALEHFTSVDDDGDAVNFECKTPATLLDPNQIVRVGRIIVDVDPNGQQLTAYLNIDNVETTLGLIDGPSRKKVEFTADRSGRVASVRIEGALHNIIEIFHIKARISLAGQETDKELFEPTTPYKMLWLGWGNDVMPRFGLLRAKSVNQINTQTIRSRAGSTLLFDTATGNLFKDCDAACPVGQFARIVRDVDAMYGGPAIRMSSASTEASASLYAAIYNSVTNVIALIKWVNQSINDTNGTTITSVVQALLPGDVLQITATALNHYEVSVNTVTILTATDTDVDGHNPCTGWVDINQKL
jgi:hypothetical protein